MPQNCEHKIAYTNCRCAGENKDHGCDCEGKHTKKQPKGCKCKCEHKPSRNKKGKGKQKGKHKRGYNEDEEDEEDESSEQSEISSAFENKIKGELKGYGQNAGLEDLIYILAKRERLRRDEIRRVEDWLEVLGDFQTRPPKQNSRSDAEERIRKRWYRNEDRGSERRREENTTMDRGLTERYGRGRSRSGKDPERRSDMERRRRRVVDSDDDLVDDFDDDESVVREGSSGKVASFLKKAMRRRRMR